MYKSITTRMVFLLLVLVLISPPVPVTANNTKGFPVLVSIESYDKTLLREETSAFTFREAIQKLAEKNGLELTLTQSGSKSRIYSVENIKNSHFKGSDGWYGYILRKDSLLTPDDFLNLTLDTGDILTLYYGEPDKTKILSGFKMELRDDLAAFTALAEHTEWVPKEGSWVKNTVNQQVPNVKIHMFVPGGTQKILSTAENGSVSTRLTRLGIYKYYAEGYAFNKAPNIVRTGDDYFLYGIKNKNRLTRSEAAAFIVNTYNPRTAIQENYFEDIDPKTPHYTEILKAVSAGIVSGYEDGTFRPDQPVSLLQFCVMLSRLYPDSNDPAEIPGVPEWAQRSINRLLASGVLLGVPLNWDDTVGEEQLMQIYMNTNYTES